MRAWRLVGPRWVDTAFSGEGARLAGGRWNSKGTAVVYLAESLALAALELLVHIDHSRALREHWAIPVEFDEALVTAVAERDVPPHFPAPRTIEETQMIGDAWVRSRVSALLRVPSAVVRQESNYLFDPTHPDAGRVSIGEAVPFTYDERLVRRTLEP